MTIILAVSSQVARGAVGNSAAVPALARLGVEVWPVPTVVWSNHPGHGAPAGLTIPAGRIVDIVDRLAATGQLRRCDAVHTGYFAEPAQVAAASHAVNLVRAANASALVSCDPIIGDDAKGRYVAEQVATAIKDQLVANADLITPNRFELAWLSGRQVETLNDAIAAARTLAPAEILATSIPGRDGHLLTVYISARHCHVCETPWRGHVPHGLGDLLAALLLGYRLQHRDAASALGLAVAWIERVLDAGCDDDDLNLAGAFAIDGEPAPLPVETME